MIWSNNFNTGGRRIKIAGEVLGSTKKKFESYTEKAISITESLFDKRKIVFNPIYISNICVNDCPYCGFRKTNNKVKRRTLSTFETAIEAKFLEKRDIKHILVLAGDYSKNEYLSMIIENLITINNTISPEWLGVEIAPLDLEDYRLLASHGVKSVTLFQETYNIDRYKQLHKITEPKGNYYYRLESLSRAIDAGINEVGLGVLYGLGDWQFETLEMLKHASNLLEKKNSLKLRFSFPRLKYSEEQAPHVLSEYVGEDSLFRAIVATRLAFPEASLVLTGRESSNFLLKSLRIADIVGKAGSTRVGGYRVYNNTKDTEQFNLNCDNSFEIFRKLLIQQGYLLT